MASVVADRPGRPVRRLLALAVLVLPLLGGVGCTHPCLALAEEMCECEDTQLQREECLRRMRFAYDNAPEDELDARKAQCSDLLDTCTCETLDTEEGKQACGLARQP